MPAPMSAPALAAVLGDGWRRPGRTASALADALRGLVVDGRVPARTRIPSERDLSAQLAISGGLGAQRGPALAPLRPPAGGRLPGRGARRGRRPPAPRGRGAGARPAAARR